MKRVLVPAVALLLFLAVGAMIVSVRGLRRMELAAGPEARWAQAALNAAQGFDPESRGRPPSGPAAPRGSLPAPLAPVEAAVPLETREYSSPATSVVLSEVNYHPVGGDRRDEWVELLNRSKKPVDLGGWKLEGGVQFTFAPGTTLDSGKFLVVGADRARLRAALGIEGIAGDWTGSLDDGGERIRLSTSDGKVADVLEYDDRAPFPVLPDGLGRTLERRNPHEKSDSPANWGSSAPAGSAGWIRLQAAGVATSSRFYLYLQGAGTAYVDDVVLREPGGGVVFHDDFEGQDSLWGAVGNHSTQVESGVSHAGSHALKVEATGAGAGRRSSVFRDLPGVQEGRSYALEIWAYLPPPRVGLVARFSSPGSGAPGFSVEASRGESVASATPGRVNSINTAALPPFVYPVTHSPARPAPGDGILVKAKVAASAETRKVLLEYMEAGAPRSTPLSDDGDSAHGDEARGDGVWSARIGPFSAGTLVLYRITAEDATGAAASFPLAENPTRWAGFQVSFPAAASALPEYQFLLTAEALRDLESNPFSDVYRPGLFIHDGRVYPGVGFRYRGQTSRGIPKHHWKVKFAKDDPFVPSPGHREVSTVNLNSAFADGTYVREVLSYNLWRDLGEASSEAWHARVTLNGSPLGLYVYVENPGDDYLQRNHLEKGWLWKAYDEGYRGASGFELKAGDAVEGRAALDQFLHEVDALSGEKLEAYLKDHVNVDSFVNFLVACQLIHSADHVQKNYLVHGTPDGKFTYLPWDMDLTHGHNFECQGGGIWGGELRWDLWDPQYRDQKLLFGTQAHRKCDGWTNVLIDAFLRKTEAFRPLYYKRLAENLAHYYHPDVLLPKVERWRKLLQADGEADLSRWPSYSGGNFDKAYRDLTLWTRKRFDHLGAKLKALGYEVGPPLNADFDSDVKTGRAPLTVAFENRSAGNFDACAWDFGDGETSAERSPVHAFRKPGRHTVTLKVTGPAGTHVQARKDFVHVRK